MIDNLTDKLCFKLKIITNGRIHGEVIKTLIFLDNWADVCEEICRSNIIQRDNLKFARKLNKDLVKLAKERSDLVSTHITQLTQINVSDFQAQNDDMWSERSRRKVILAIISEWLKGSKKTTVKKLLSALNGPGWFDVKLRVEKLLLVNVNVNS